MSSSINNKPGVLQWLHLFFAASLAITFFLPWVSWGGTLVTGSALASGDFFRISASQFKLDNPFPQLSFSFYAFWLVPALAVISAAFLFLKKKTVPFSYIAGAAGLSLFSIYYLFTGVLVDLGVGKSVVSMLKPAAWFHLLASAGLIITALPVNNWLPKIAWLIIGPVIAYAGFKFIEKKTMAETFAATEDIKADFTLEAGSLINEFLQNDSTAKKKYLEKVLVVNGKISKLELLSDSTSTISFADSTGSYAIFSLEKEQFEQVKTLKEGDPVSMKGVCSGSMFSEILGSTAITFKRATFNSEKNKLLNTKIDKMKKTILSLALITLTGFAFAQPLTTTSATVAFDATTPIDALPKAENKTVIASLNKTTGDVKFEAVVANFAFSNPKIQEHFNGANWLNSAQFPKFTFGGKIDKLSKVKFNKNGVYKTTVSGDLEVKGIKKKITAPATITVANGKVSATANFTVVLADFSISGAPIDAGKVAKEPKVTVSASF